MYSNRSPPTVPAGMVLPYISIPGRCGMAPSTGISLSRKYASRPESREDVVIAPRSKFAGEPVIDTELSRTGADQPDKEEHVQDFRKVEEIVEPVKRRKSFRHGGKRVGQDGDTHIYQQSHAGRARKKPNGQQGSANELDTRHEISHLVGKRDFGLNEGFVNLFRAAGDKQFVCPGDGEEQPDRNAYQQVAILFQITATQQRKLDQPFPIHLFSLPGRKWRCRSRILAPRDYVSIRSTH